MIGENLCPAGTVVAEDVVVASDGLRSNEPFDCGDDILYCGGDVHLFLALSCPCHGEVGGGDVQTARGSIVWLYESASCPKYPKSTQNPVQNAT
jgi:hypothetical protein